MRLALSLLVVAAVSVVPVAYAQPLPLDVVQLANGGMVRGTIIENIPGDHVTIQEPSGDTRRFAASEVRSAGPAPAAAPVIAPPTTAPIPPAPGPYAPPAAYPPQQGYGAPPGYAPQPQLDPSLVTLRVAAATPGITLHRLTGSAAISMWTGRGMSYGIIDNFEPICTAPCAVQVPRGTVMFGLSQGEGRPRRADHALFNVTQNTDLNVEYESREGWRIAGWGLFIAATVGYLVAALVPIEDPNYLTIFGVASAIYLATMIGTLIMVCLNDHADVRPVGGAPPSGQF